ncbi:Thymidylate kinase [Lentzea albidocapillata subsp. violacea]|uniref:Thymidylate kinase n=1 Tax=Lentzea albidocapillata subsp. violacea TaxID=128104 RepID=A0A1G9XU80_9PSEU|nr:AAA family ATPase [Lentzea albidocapillata]SDN00389.1 Thymidylate kinase [Lentzea albidocapillata subsp. violacea]
MVDPARFPFIALEGTDGSGKSTLRGLLHDGLNSKGRRCFMVGQHGWLDVDAGRVVLAARTQRLGVSRDELMRAYARDKLLHLRENIEPALDTVAVLADRYIYSDAVYHEVLYGIPARATLENHRELGTREPDVVVFVDTDPDVASDRTITRAKSLRPHETPGTLRRLHRAYVELFTGELFTAHGPRVLRVNNNESDPERVAEDVLAELEQLFPHDHTREVATSVIG